MKRITVAFLAVILTSGMLAGSAFAADTIFVPLDPCRLIDTRFSVAGKMGVKETRAFDIVGATTDYSSQGGQAAGCGVPGFSGGPIVQAVAVNVVAVSPDGAGHLRAWAGDQATMPLAAILTFDKMNPNLAISNGIVIPVRQDAAGSDMNVYAHNSVHIVMDVVGYYTTTRTDAVDLAPGTKLGSLPIATTSDLAAHVADVSSHYVRTIVVSPLGTDVENGTALLDTMASIPGPRDAANPYLVKIEPGTYDLGTSSLQMQEYVDIEGSGEKVTTITSAISDGGWIASSATVRGKSNAELRFLTVENTGTGNYSVGIRNQNESPSLLNVSITVSGGSQGNAGIVNTTDSSTVENVTVDVSGAGNCYGFYNSASSVAMENVKSFSSCTTNSTAVHNSLSDSVSMKNVTLTAFGGSANNTGVDNSNSSPTMSKITGNASGGTTSIGVKNSSSSPIMTNVEVTASEGTGSNYGVRNVNSSSPIMTNVSASASGGALSMAVRNESSSPVMTYVTANASGGSSVNVGLYSIVSGTVAVNHSVINCSQQTLTSGSGVTTLVGNTQLNGGPAVNSGALACVGVYDENYVALNSACQ